MNCGTCIYGQSTGHKECDNCVGSNYISTGRLDVDNTLREKILEKLKTMKDDLEVRFYYDEGNKAELLRLLNQINNILFDVNCIGRNVV